tara:strand:- start:323 stop:454 length:132 start_codon:yes stop_codon:yes gene_type:complete
MNEDTVTVTIKGVEHYFNDDELTSAGRKAIDFIEEKIKEEVIF